jgi:NADH-quinone oxidoreductase subunit J
MNPEQIIFYVIAALVLTSALMVVATKNLVRSLFLFFVTLFSVAGLFVFTLADFVAVTQVVIYVGGVLVLMLFAFLLSGKQLLNNVVLLKTGMKNLQHLPAVFVALLFLFILVITVLQTDFNHLEWIRAQQLRGSNMLQPQDNTLHLIGINLMTRYLLPFEVVSVLLLMALTGAAHLARKEKVS